MTTVPLHEAKQLGPKITVIGVGGAGGNAVNNMIRSKLEGVKFVVANTDAQSLVQSLADTTIQLGPTVTKGLGAGSLPDCGKEAAEESLEDVIAAIKGTNMLFITAGAGGGTGTGAAPVIARAAREMGVLTIGVVTKPFHFEGAHRMRTAEKGIEELQQYVDTLIVIPNQNLFRVSNERTTFADAFNMADDVLYSGVRGVTDLMIMPGLINLDFADIRTVMGEMGKAMMGTGEATGDNRAIQAAEAAISNPLLDDVSMKGARGVLINITGGMDLTLYEVDEAANRIREEVDPEANIIFGSIFDEKLNGCIRVSVVATGIDVQQSQRQRQAADHAAQQQVAAKAHTSFGAPGFTYGTANQTQNQPSPEYYGKLQEGDEALFVEQNQSLQQRPIFNQSATGLGDQQSYSASPYAATPAAPVEKEVPKRSPSFFERLTGVSRRQQPEAPKVQSFAPAPIQPVQYAAKQGEFPGFPTSHEQAPQSYNEPSYGAPQNMQPTGHQGQNFTQHPQSDSQRDLRGRDNTPAEQDLLEIPAFLRRQPQQ